MISKTNQKADRGVFSPTAIIALFTGYYHELFLRGMPDLAARILRTTVKNKGPRKAASPSTEPNLYAYSFLSDADNTMEQKEEKERMEGDDCKVAEMANRETSIYPLTSHSMKSTSPTTSVVPNERDVALPSLRLLSGLVVASSNQRMSPSLCQPSSSINPNFSAALSLLQMIRTEQSPFTTNASF